MARKHPKFGQKVRGIYASVDNPYRDGYFVEVVRRTGRMNPGVWYRLTDAHGRFWEYKDDSVILLTDTLGDPGGHNEG